MTAEFELLEATFTQIERFLEIVQQAEKHEQNWNMVKEIAKRELGVGDERLYKIRNACVRLRFVEKRLGKCALTAEGLRMLNCSDRLDFLTRHLYQLDDKLNVLRSVVDTYEYLSIPLGDYINLMSVADQLRTRLKLKSLHRLWATLNTLYGSVDLIKLKGIIRHNEEPDYSQVQVRLEPTKMKSIAKNLPWRTANEVPDEVFFQTLHEVYEKLSKQLGTRYVSIPELRKQVGHKLRLYSDEFNSKLLKLPPVFLKKRILLVSPRGPREGAIKVERPDGTIEYYLHILID